MKVLLPFSTKPSLVRRAQDFIDPKASDPEPGSVIAHAPTFSRVSKGGTNSRFCASVPRRMIAPAVRPMLTPSAVTMPGLWRQSSMMGSIRSAAASALWALYSWPSLGGGGATLGRPSSASFFSSFSSFATCICPIPKVSSIFRRMS